MRLHRKHRRWLRWIPRKKHLHGSWLHRRFGERLFHSDLWAPSQRGLSLGFAVGAFIAFTPTIGAQFILAGIAAYLLRVNLPIALAACLLTNPLTAPFVYGLQYKLGAWLVGVPAPAEMEGYYGWMKNTMRHAKPLLVGSVVMGASISLVGYALLTSYWPAIDRLLHRGGDGRGVKVKPPRPVRTGTPRANLIAQ